MAEDLGDATALLVEADDRGICRITMNRPAVHNAFDEHMIGALTEALEAAAEDPSVRVVVLSGAGKSFSAGADLTWMRRMAGYGAEENLSDARALARLMRTLYQLPKPTVAAVNGAALGGGVGLVCCCDLAIAEERATFGTTEVRLGLIPAVIGPYVVGAIGSRHARRLMVTGERIDALEAARLGLVHVVARKKELDDEVAKALDVLLANGPRAMAEAKRLAMDLAGQPISQAVIDDTAERIARIRASAEGREGVAAFLDKRRPSWG